MLGISRKVVTPPLRSARPAVQVFFVGGAGLAEMNLIVNHARNQKPPVAVYHFVGTGGAGRINIENDIAFN